MGTCADCIRVTDDYTKFRVTFSMGTALVGMHGSFVVNRASLERRVTYDYGTEGSFTEDAYFAFGALKEGFKFAFIDGYMEEKSPFGFMDFIKQRRRWMNGLTLLSKSSEFPLRIRWMLRTFMMAWSLMPSMLPTYLLGFYVILLREGCQLSLQHRRPEWPRRRHPAVGLPFWGNLQLLPEANGMGQL